MERSFIASKSSKYVESLDKYRRLGKQQQELINRFFTEKGIEADGYLVSGNGFVDKPFNENDKKDITISIVPSENDLVKFAKMLCKPSGNHGLYAFKKSSSIAKEFSQKCIEEQIIINLHAPRVSDYFPSVGYHGCNYDQFRSGDDLYIKVKNDYLKEDDTPEGFTEIKISEFYVAKEKLDKEES